ncbi:MAG: TatD family hydrolase [Cyanophyceae cyanobacterium]
MQLVDTHVHINFDVFQGDLARLEHRWQEAGVAYLIHSCVEPSEFEGIQALANRFRELFFAIGLHPLDARKWNEQMGQKVRELACCDSRIVAIGETGLDFYKDQNKQEQLMALEAQLELASQLDKPVIIHCREAAVCLREVLKTRTARGVMHCWSGTPAETKWFLDLGFYISFSGIVTFKNAQSVQASAQIVPSDRLLIETDCPYLAPVPRRGKRNEPAYVRHVAEFLSQLRQVPLETLASQTTQNACQLFSLPRLAE